MANTVFKLRRSSVAGKVPNTSTLSIGELAINLTDKKLFSSDGFQVFETGANLTTLTVSTNTSVNNVIITGGIYANGEYGSDGQVLKSNGSVVYWGTGGGSANGILDVRQQYVGDGVTNTYIVTGGYRPNDLSVFINGVMLRNGTDVDVSDGGIFSLTVPASNGALIDVVGIGTFYANGTSSTTSQQFTANGTANSFTVSGGYVPNQIQVYLNGVKQVPGTDVIINSGSTVNFATTPANGFIVDIFGYQTTVVSGVDTAAQYLWTNTHTFTQTINATSNNSLYLDGLSGSGYQTTAGLSANVLTLVANNVTYVGSITAANVVSNGQLQANLGNYLLIADVVSTVASLTSNNTLYVGTTTSANVVSNAQLQANLTNYQTSAGLASNVVTLTSNSTNYVGSVDAANVVSNAQLQANLTNYQTSAGMSDNVATLTANNTSYVGTVSAANVVSNAQLQANLGNYQTTAGLSSNVLTLTANNTTYVGSVTAANVVSNAQLQANVSTLQGEITANAATAYTNSVSYTDSKSFVNSSQLSSNLSNYALLSGATFTGNVAANNANTTYDLNVGRNLYVSGNLTIGSNVNIIGANNLSVIDNMIYLNSNNTYTNPDIGFAGNYNDGTYHHTGFFRDHSSGVWKVYDNYDPEPDANIYIDQTNTSFHLANFQANTIYIGNNSSYATINLSSFTGTANNTLYVGSVDAANVVSNAQLQANLGNYQTTAGLASNVLTLTSNSSNYIGSLPAANVVSNAQLIANLANYQTSAGLASNVALLTANNANNLLGYTWNSPGAIGSVTANSGAFTNVTVSTFVSVGNSSVNSTVNTSVLQIANTTGTANITPTAIFLGNSTVNCVINSTSVYVNGVDYNPTTALAIAVALS